MNNTSSNKKFDLSNSLASLYSKDTLSARQAQYLAHQISYAPVIFQISRLMLKFGIFKLLSDHPEGISVEEISAQSNLSLYAVQILLESSLTLGTILVNPQTSLFTLSKTGWFLLNDSRVKINLEFNHAVNYLGLYHLEESLLSGKPEGLKHFGSWNTIYEGLTQLPPETQASWFAFDHFYSDESFEEALKIILSTHPRKLLDIGGNSGRWALRCVQTNPDIQVTVLDLPSQLEVLQKTIAGQPGAERIHCIPGDILSSQTLIPEGFDVIWMSQFLDCFSAELIILILRKVLSSMNEKTLLYILELFWDKQNFEASAFCLTQTSPYFTAMANGYSKIFHSQELTNYLTTVGLEIKNIHNHLKGDHTLLCCRKPHFI